jgi:hypothetical protein
MIILSPETFRYNYGVVNTGGEETLNAEAKEALNAEVNA